MRFVRVFVIFFLFAAGHNAAFAEDVSEDPSGSAAPLVYPDLTPCLEKLRDPSVYKGSKGKLFKQIEPGKDGWLFRTVDFRSDFTMPDKTFDSIVSVKDALKRKGVDLYVVVQPPRAMLMHDYVDPEHMPQGYDWTVAKTNYKAMVQRLNDAGIYAVDLSDIPSGLDYFFKGDFHWRKEGAQWSAEQVSNMIRENPQYGSIEKQEFSVEITDWLKGEKGDFDDFVEEVCGVTMPSERLPVWATTLVSDSVSEDSLFGSPAYPDIAIVGTSNTANQEDFNFVGFLKQALEVDVRNHAVAGGAFSGAARLFFSSEEFHKYPPKILIWEFLSHHNFDDYAGFRQMLPAIEGGCTDEEALVVSDILALKAPKGSISSLGPSVPVPVIAGISVGPSAQGFRKAKRGAPLHEVVFLDYLEDKHIKAGDVYLDLGVVEPGNRVLKVSTLYANGDADTIDVSRSRHGENNGRYFIDFTGDIDQELMLIQIETDKPEGTIKARLCSKNKNI